MHGKKGKPIIITLYIEEEDLFAIVKTEKKLLTYTIKEYNLQWKGNEMEKCLI